MQFDVLDLGHRDYDSTTELQRQLVEEVLAGSRTSTLIFVEHDPVLTLGANFHEENLLFSRADYERQGIQVVRTDRGGDVTYHGPGQLVIYPIFDVAQAGKDLHKWLRDLEEAILIAIAEFGLEGRRFPPHTGVWVNDRKIAAIGIKIRRWVSMHGIALNCNGDLAPFGLIVPCGIQEYGVTSLSMETGRNASIEEAKPAVLKAVRQVFR